MRAATVLFVATTVAAFATVPALAQGCAPAQAGTYLKSSRSAGDGRTNCEYALLPKVPNLGVPAAGYQPYAAATPVAPGYFWCPDGTVFEPRWRRCVPVVRYGYAADPNVAYFLSRVLGGSRHHHLGGGYDPRNPGGGRQGRHR